MRSSCCCPGDCHCLAPAVLVVGLLLSNAASAVAGTLSTTYFRIDAQNASGSAFWQVSSADASISYDSGTNSWTWSTGLRTLSNGASLNDATLTIVGDPADFRRIGLTFSANAGISDTTFTIRTAVLTFDSPLPNADTLASPSLTLTRQGDPHTASVVGSGGDGGTSAYAAYRDGILAYELLPGLTTQTSDTQSANTGWNAVGGAISSINVLYAFEVTAGDQVSGSSNYVVTPEPASAVLLALFGLALTRRRF